MTEFIEGAPCRACGKTTRYVSTGKCVACTRRHMTRRNAQVKALKWASDRERVRQLEAEVRQLRAMIGAAELALLRTMRADAHDGPIAFA